MKATTTAGLTPMEEVAYRLYARWCGEHGTIPADATAEQWTAFCLYLSGRYAGSTANNYRYAARRAARLVANQCATAPTASHALPAGIDPRLAELWAAIQEMACWREWGPQDAEFRAALVMLAPLALDTMDPAALTDATGFDADEVGGFIASLRKNGIWTADGKLTGEWADPEHGGVAVLIDAWVAIGDLERAPAGDAAEAAAVCPPADIADVTESDQLGELAPPVASEGWP